MSKIPCRKCRACGTYNNLTIDTCACGKSLAFCLPSLEDREALLEKSPEKCGNLDVIEFYVQTCPACGRENYLLHNEDKLSRCPGCNKTQINEIDPVRYDGNDEKADDEETESPKAKIAFAGEGDEDSPSWLAKKHEKISNALGKTEEEQNDNENVRVDDDDDDDDEIVDWSDFDKKPTITLTAVRYGALTFSVSPKEGEKYMLGRSANQSEFLEKDTRVGNEHCYLTFENKAWFVTDNHSSNGTFVGNEDIGYNGKRELHDGEILVLGHNSDSMAFLLTIK